MPKLANVDELLCVGEAARREIEARRQAGTTIYVGMGTCGIAAGARDTLRAIQDELARRGIEASIEGVGCIGLCFKEPLVDIQQPGQPRVTYGNIGPRQGIAHHRGARRQGRAGEIVGGRTRARGLLSV